jgi:CheY-like chemotaxis protein
MARILIVEDNEMNLLLARDVLEARGHEVVAATSAVQCRERLRGPRPDVVLMDIRLPDGDGESLLHEIRAAPTLAALPVVAVTAQAMHGDRERFMEAGFDGYLSKPLDIRTFGTEVESYFR